MKFASEECLKFLEMALEESAEGVLIVDAEGHPMFQNAAARRIPAREYSSELPIRAQLAGLSFRYPDGRPMPPEEIPVSRALAGEAVAGFRLILARPDGTEVHISSTANPVRDKQGVVIGAFAIIRDITEQKKTEDALRDSERRYRTLAEAAHDSIFVIDRDDCVQYVNSFAAALFQLRPEEIIGKCREELFPPEVAEIQKRNLRQVLETGKPSYREDKTPFPTREVWLGSWLAPIAEEGGEVTAVLGTARDITARKTAEDLLRESEQRYKNLVELTSDIIYASDLMGNQTFMNDAAFRVLEAEPEEVIGQPWLKWIHPEDREKTLKTFLEMMEQGTDVFGFENRYVSKSGTMRYFLHNVRVLRDEKGEIVGTQGIARDITERKRAEQLREEYVSLISHDLRNPLTPLMGMADWLRRILRKQGLDREAHSAETILTSARRMNAMIEEMVESARLEEGQLEMRRQATDLFHLLSELTERVGSVEDRVRLRMECPEWVPPVPADHDRIERVVVNLITNALKYSSPQTPVLIRLVQREGEAVVSVTDQGPGIAAEDLPHVFDRLYRSKAGEERAEGLGLGLYIARMIVEAHSGRIWAETEVGKGSTFSFALPMT